MLLQPQLMSLKCSCGRCCDRRRVSGHFSSCKAGAEDAARVRECSEAKVECGTGSGTATMTQSEQSERWIDAHEEYIHQHKSEGAQTDRQSLHTHKWFHASHIYPRDTFTSTVLTWTADRVQIDLTFHIRTDQTPHAVAARIHKDRCLHHTQRPLHATLSHDGHPSWHPSRHQTAYESMHVFRGFLAARTAL